MHEIGGRIRACLIELPHSLVGPISSRLARDERVFGKAIMLSTEFMRPGSTREPHARDAHGKGACESQMRMGSGVKVVECGRNR